ncbi:glycosyltransferase [Dietzia cinnamea]|uniref:glycosyltransferase n=1 Tax=Dietzia cinnamea TaxID=321318 RepID=UPI001957116B|nr:glycosyltransferase [Dietzia cinnamea]
MPVPVLHITSAHDPLDNRIYRKECHALSDAGFDVTLLAPHLRDGYVFEGPVRVRTFRPAGGRLTRFFGSSIRMWRIVVRENPLVLHAHDPELIPLVILYKLFRPSTRIVYDAHEDLPDQVAGKDYIPAAIRPLVGLACVALLQLVNRASDIVVVATPAIARRFTPGKVTLVQNFPMASDFESQTDDFATYTLSFVGGLNKIRGGHELIAALKLVDGASCVMAGGLSDDLKPVASKSPQVHHLGNVPAGEVGKVIGQGLAGVVTFLPLPNHIESQPTKLFEYMASGRPVICSDFPLWREILEPVGCAYFVDPTSSESIASAIRQVMSEPEIAIEKGRQARKAFESRFSFESEAARLVGSYKASLEVGNPV